MATIGTQNIAQTSVHMRWREPYVTEGVNVVATAVPAGCYRGFWVDETMVPSTAIRLRFDEGLFGMPAGVDLDSFAVVANATTGYAIAVREGGDITMDLAALGVVFPVAAPISIWLSISTVYASHVATTAQYIVSDSNPLVGDPAATVIARLSIDAGAVAINIYTGFPNTLVDYSWRTVPQATQRELMADYVPGDRVWGLLEGRDRWCLPTVAEKKALDNAPTPAISSNPYVTKADTISKVFGEPTVATVSLLAGTSYVTMTNAVTGPYYVGTGIVGTAQRYFDVRIAGELNGCKAKESIGQYYSILSIYNVATAAEMNPAADADTGGFYAGDIRVYFVYSYSSANPVSLDIWYNRKRTYTDLEINPAYAFPLSLAQRHDHADIVAAQKANTPPGLPLQIEAMTNHWLDKLARKTRGTHSMLLSEEELASRLFSPSHAEAQVYSSACQTTITTVGWARVFATGVNEVGPVPAQGLAGGERFLLYSYTFGGHEQVRRVIINQDGSYGTTMAIDVLTQIHLDNIAAVPNIATWFIVSMCSDGRYLYVRAMATWGGVVYSAIDCWDLVNKTRRWVNSVLIGNTAAGTTVFDDDYTHNAQHIIIVNATYVAVNQYWVDTKDGGAVGRGIALYRRDTGVAGAVGYGNAGSFSIADALPAGPMVSDGTYIYFTVRSNLNTGPFGIGHCAIVNPQTNPPRVGATFPEYNTGAMIPGVLQNNPCSLIYDGALVWLSTRFTMFAGNCVAAAGYDTTMYFDNVATTYWAFGPAMFDGKHIWVCVADVDAGLDNTSTYHLVRFNPGSISMSYTAGTLWGFWHNLIAQSKRWVLEPPRTGQLNFAGLGQSNYFGNMIYDGDTLYWNLRWFASTALQKLPGIHGV